jgi:hypothetical protein
MKLCLMIVLLPHALRDFWITLGEVRPHIYKYIVLFIYIIVSSKASIYIIVRGKGGIFIFE